MSRLGDWSLSVRLARREMRVGIRGFGVFLACLSLGVFAISGIGSFSAAARAGLLADARSLLGGDLEVRLFHREVTPAQRSFLEAAGTLSRTVGMSVMAGRALQEEGAEERAGRPGGRETRILTRLKAVDEAYPLYGTVGLEPGTPLDRALEVREGRHGAVVDEEVLERLGLRVGDRLAVGATEYDIRAVLAREPDRTVQGFLLAPRILVSDRSLQATGLLLPGSLVRYAYRLRMAREPVPEDRVEALRAELESRFPEAGWRVHGFSEAAPRVQYFLDRMKTNLTLVGLCTLLVGGLGVAGAVRGYLGGKLLHIAAMKCVGASARVIFRAYLLQILGLAAAGALLGLVGGCAVPYAVDAFLGQRLPVPLRPALFPAPMATAGAFGMLIALLFSLGPLGSALRVSPTVLFRGYAAGGGGGPEARSGWRLDGVRAVLGCLLLFLALATSGDTRLVLWFALGAAGCFGLFRLLAAAVVRAARAAPLPRSPRWRLAVAGVRRPASLAAQAVFSLGLGLTALVSVVLVEGSLSTLVEETVPSEAPSFFFLDIQPNQVEEFESVVRGVPGAGRTERQATLRGRITRIAGVPVEEARIAPESSWAVRGDRFLSYAADPPDPRQVVTGTWWPAHYRGPPLLSLTADLAEGFGVAVGDTLTVNVLGREITAEIANLREVDWSTLALNFAIIFAPGVLERAPRTYLASVYATGEAEQDLFDAVTSRFANVSAIRTKALLRGAAVTLGRIGAAFKAVAGLTVVTGFLVLGGALSADQRRRIREAVIYKVCGATRWDILGVFAAEFLLVGMAAGTISALVGTGAAFPVVEGIMNAEFVFRPSAVAFTVLLGLVLTLMLGLLGTARVLRRKPAPYLRNE